MKIFGVQRISKNGENATNTCATVQAHCALKAGEIVLAEPLSLHGQVTRAKVWWLRDDLTPHFVELYAAPPYEVAKI